MTDTDFLAERMAPKTTALIVVDVQNDFCHGDSPLAKAGNDMSATYDQAKHDATLRNMADHFGVVVKADEVIEAWQHVPVLAG